MTLDVALREGLGWLGFFTNVGGNILVGRKSEHGWWVRILSNALWFVYSWHTLTVPVSANAIVFAMINVHYWRVWRKDRAR